jgi:hypothetical protein
VVDVAVTTRKGTSATSLADRFSYEPAVTKVEPNRGPQAGGTLVTITGSGFTGATEVKFGLTKASSFTVNSPTSITAVTPAGTGAVDVTVTTLGGTSAIGMADEFGYESTDQFPPTFAGLKSAYMCFPGPTIPETAAVHLGWEAATDDVTPSSEITYNVYQATTSGGENYSTATYTTAPGATEFETPPLLTSETHFFVVRARDKAGLEDSNTVEKRAENLCV